MQLRSGRFVLKVTQPKAPKSFDMIGRAPLPKKGNIIVTRDQDIRNLVQAKCQHIVECCDLSDAENKAITLENSYKIAEYLKGKYPMKPPAPVGKWGYALIGYNIDSRSYLYYSPVAQNRPLQTTPLRKSPKAPNPSYKLPPCPPCNEEVYKFIFNGPIKDIGFRESTQSAMGGESARNYAALFLTEEAIKNRKWEWLHILGHALGGEEKRGNLVAGTFAANTQMIPHEKRILEATRHATPEKPFYANYTVCFFPNSWVAMDIIMEYGWCNGTAPTVVTIRTLSSLAFDKLMYAIAKLE